MERASEALAIDILLISDKLFRYFKNETKSLSPVSGLSEEEENSVFILKEQFKCYANHINQTF